MIQVGVLSAAGREPMLERTVAELELRGPVAALPQNLLATLGIGIYQSQ